MVDPVLRIGGDTHPHIIIGGVIEKKWTGMQPQGLDQFRFLGNCPPTRGSQIRQIWCILHQNCSDDSAEVTEGAISTPEIFGKKHSFVLTFSQQIQFTLIVNVANLN